MRAAASAAAARLSRLGGCVCDAASSSQASQTSQASRDAMMTRAARRGYAKPTMKGISAPASASGAQGRAGAMRIIPQSPNVIAEPYVGPLRKPTVFESLTSSKGARYAYDAVLSRVKDTYALSKCTKDIRGFTLEGFKAEAKQMYRMINASAVASSGGGKGKTLGHEVRHATTDRTQTDLKRERKTRADGGWERIVWDLVDVNECQVVRGRLIMANPNEPNGAGFVQLTTRFRSRQIFAAYDARGRLASGDPNEVLDVEDFWVFEHGLKIPNSRWRLAGRLHMPDLSAPAALAGAVATGAETADK